MAFSLSGILNRLTRPGFYALGSHFPEVDVQIRGYAARKGTREKALKKKRALKMKRAAQAAQEEKRKKISTVAPGIKKTVDPILPPIPDNVNVYFAELYKPKEYSIREAVDCFKENFHPTILNIDKTKIQVFIELNMVAEKQTKVLTPWRNIVCYPHIFDTGFKKRVLVLCKDTYIENAMEAGADLAGGIQLIKNIKKGEVDLTIYDRVIGQLDFWDEISMIRSKLKTMTPRTQDGSLTVDFLRAIPKFKYGVEYVCNLSATESAFGWIETQIGTSIMESELVDENFLTLLKDINTKRPKREGDFITCVHCKAAGCREKFRIGFAPYLDELAKRENSEQVEKQEEDSESSVAAA